MHVTAFPWTHLRALLCAVCTVLAAGVPARGAAQVARTEIHPFASTTLTDQEFLAGKKEGKPVTIAGELRLPRPGTDRPPAVVLLHGSGGLSGYVTDWVDDLNAMGVATFLVDSFTGRGIVNTNNDQSQLGRTAMIVDAYRALELLNRHPRIDPGRILLLGFSRGGQAALYASLKRFQRTHGTTGREFAAYVAFYPSCITSYHDDLEVSDRPIRLFHGTADDYVPVAPCRAYVERLSAKGANVQLTEYPGAGHVFDGRAYRPPVKLEKAQTARRCSVVEGEEGALLNATTRQPFTWADPCVELGPTVAYDEKASADVRKAVKELVTSVKSVTSVAPAQAPPR